MSTLELVSFCRLPVARGEKISRIIAASRELRTPNTRRTSISWINRHRPNGRGSATRAARLGEAETRTRAQLGEVRTPETGAAGRLGEPETRKPEPVRRGQLGAGDNSVRRGQLGETPETPKTRNPETR